MIKNPLEVFLLTFRPYACLITIGQYGLDIYAGKQLLLRTYRCLINTDVEQMNGN